MLDLRLPVAYATAGAVAPDALIRGRCAGDAFLRPDGSLFEALARHGARGRRAAAAALRRRRSQTSGRPFDFDDCSLGNLVFAGGFLLAGRDFNRAVDDYCALVGLPPGLIENVTDGTDAYLVAIDGDGRLLATEEAIVDAARPNRIRDIFLLDRPLTADEIARLAARQCRPRRLWSARQPQLRLNPRVAQKIAAGGTHHLWARDAALQPVSRPT